MIEIQDKTKCCGCSACANICPVTAIKMEPDEEGFLYPNVDTDTCINCGKCNKVCPIINALEPTPFERKVYICQNKNEKIRLDSTSGGVFSALAKYVLDRNGYVFGAEFDENWTVIHGYTQNEDELGRFRGSKYVQSNACDSFRLVKEFLEENQWVLFSGTPCQIGGLHNFLGKEYEKLILMDIVCFSISSPGVWKAYLSHLEATDKIDISKVKRIKFRDKTKYGYEYTLMTFYDEKGKELYSSGPESNQMLRSFVSNTSTRPSCYDCKFKKVNRVSDFTAWDCYNVYRYDTDLDDNKGTSHVLIHNQKAEDMLEELSSVLLLKNVDLEKAVMSEPAMIQCAEPNEKRAQFFQEFGKEDPFNVFFQESAKTYIERALRKNLSKLGLYRFIKRMIKK